MKIYFAFYSFLILILINIFLFFSTIYLSIFGINYSFNYSKIEIKNMLNTFIEKDRYIINYSDNKNYLDLVWADLYSSRISIIENDLEYENHEKWEIYLDYLEVDKLEDEINLYNSFLNLLNIPISFLQFSEPQLLENNDFSLVYTKNAFSKMKKFNNSDSIFNKNYWYFSDIQANFYRYISESVQLYLTMIEQLMLKQINEEVIILKEKIDIIDVMDIQNRRDKLNSYNFYKLEFNSYILNSYINTIFLTIVLPITLFLTIVLFLLIRFGLLDWKVNSKIKTVFTFKYC